MSMHEVELEGEGGNFTINVDNNGWAKCYLLVGDSKIFLGADDIRILAQRLISHLEDERREPVGEIAGHLVYWVVSLFEAHYTLYFYREGGVRVLLWQDEMAKLVATVKLDGKQYQKWRKQLAAVAVDKREI